MGVDLRDLLRAELRIHPRLVQQGLFTRIDARARIAAAIPPLIPFAAGSVFGLLSLVLLVKMLPPTTSLERTRDP